MGDFNAPLMTVQTIQQSCSENTGLRENGEIRILNDRQEPTHIPFQKGLERNCIDMVMITTGLEKKLKSYKLDIAREWTPARAEATGEGMGPDKVYLRGQPSDHKAQKVTLVLDIVEKGRVGKRAIINYNNPEGLIHFKTLSNKYAGERKETVRKF